MPLLLMALTLTCAGAAYLYLSENNYDTADGNSFAKGKAAYQQGQFDEAARLFKASAEMGDKKAQYNYAMLCRDGKGVDRDDAG